MSRKYIGIGPAPTQNKGWNLEEFHAHIRGRAEATVQVVISVAVLKANNLLSQTSPISVSGARWQDWSGTRESPRAHRFPCNPQISGRDLPDLADKPQLRALIQQPLAVTDFLPLYVNYADRLFEEFGGIESARRAVEYAASAQKIDCPIDISLVANAWQSIAWPGYIRAYETAERELLGRVNRDNAPTDNIEAVQDVVFDAVHSTRLVSVPPTLTAGGFTAWLEQIESSK